MKVMNKRMLVACMLTMGLLVGGILSTSSDAEVEVVSIPAEEVSQEEDVLNDAEIARALELHLHEPGLTGHQVRALLRSSRHYQNTEPLLEGTLSMDGVEQESPGEALRNALRTTPVSRVEALAYFETHRDLFGDRSFEQSQHTIQRLIRIDKIEAKLAL